MCSYLAVYATVERSRSYVKIICLPIVIPRESSPLSPRWTSKEKKYFRGYVIWDPESIRLPRYRKDQADLTLRRQTLLSSGSTKFLWPVFHVNARRITDSTTNAIGSRSFVARVLRDYSCQPSKLTRPWPWPNTFFLSSRRLFRTWHEINRSSPDALTRRTFLCIV